MKITKKVLLILLKDNDVATLGPFPASHPTQTAKMGSSPLLEITIRDKPSEATSIKVAQSSIILQYIPFGNPEDIKIHLFIRL
jgi:hypothetical protein